MSEYGKSGIGVDPYPPQGHQRAQDAPVPTLPDETGEGAGRGGAGRTEALGPYPHSRQGSLVHEDYPGVAEYALSALLVTPGQVRPIQARLAIGEMWVAEWRDVGHRPQAFTVDAAGRLTLRTPGGGDR